MASRCPIPHLSFADSDEMWINMGQDDEKMFQKRVPKPFISHPTIIPQMRSVLLDWLSEVSQVYKLRRETYFLAMDYLDRFLSLTTGLPKSRLQLLGITCLFIAAKFEEIYPPKIKSFSYVTDNACSSAEIVSMEALVLKVLNWELNPITVNCWLTTFMQLSAYPNKNECQSANDQFLIPQFSIVEYESAVHICNLAAWDEGMFLYSYKTIAAAAIYFIYNKETALHVSGYTWNQIEPCIAWLEPFAITLVTEDISIINNNKQCTLSISKPWLLYNELHIIHKHTVTLEMLHRSHQLIPDIIDEETTIDSNSSTTLNAINELIPSPPPSENYYEPTKISEQY